MLLRKAYKFRLKTNRNIEGAMSRFSGCSRFVFNKSLVLQKERLDAGEKVYRYHDLALMLTEWKKSPETEFLKEVHSQPLQQTLKSLDRALWDGLKKEKGFPRFKKKGRHDSFTYPQGVKLDGNLVYLPKIGDVRFYKSREIQGVIKNTTVSRHGQHWCVSFQTEQIVPDPIHPSSSMVGVDCGITKFAALSTGEIYSPLNSFKQKRQKLGKAQRSLARKIKFSNNWKSQKKKIGKIHITISDSRRDFLHKVSTEISKNHAIVVLEDLKVKNMSGSAKGTVDKPGKNVKAKSGLNRSILDQGWSEFQRQLDYKECWNGGQVVLVNPKNTSLRCPVCGHTDTENRKSQAKFLCQNCGHSDNADLNAATNILAAGHAVLACGDIRPIAS